MRMWKVPVGVMCNQHLLGEHLEMHMFASCIEKGKNIRGFIKNGLVETGYILKRHKELADEMTKRGMNHKSPLEMNEVQNEGKVDPESNLLELKKRCIKCREKIGGDK